MVNTGVLDQGQVQAGHIASPGTLQPLLVSAGDEEQVECTCFLENMDEWMDRHIALSLLLLSLRSSFFYYYYYYYYYYYLMS